MILLQQLISQMYVELGLCLNAEQAAELYQEILRLEKLEKAVKLDLN